MADPLIVEVVEVDQSVWSGQARQVIVNTMEGEIGILAGHVPVAGVLQEGRVVIDPIDNNRVEGRVDGGIVSVDSNRVTIVADHFSEGAAAQK
ncbi:F0F1 ATP synthase subunit epsilon [Kocuria sp. p3-SID1433]|uniref:F0F1 ATP synthase subunit epsilon n=1 Tax=unclassified Kocuria TaxID=2649579 RepID=UPI0021A27379|nr:MULTISPECIES: F0F1 ATP synthase subunit epsilon [unclassified Kocuria]MCT1602486.1 F0F1 ATP synthase subunit epsilon [Kocuria sp. p3-SID1428]MCT2180152.1 F0F1 ATP synthase subunit epsilon [Kocuria sp. p3-SID1433]